MAKNPHAVALGRKGGKKGGKARAANLTPVHLSEIGRKGAEKRWTKGKEGGGGTTPKPPAAPKP